MAKHTQGPWTAVYSDIAHKWVVQNPPRAICETFGAEDAHLIAAAPELLEALEEMLVYCPAKRDEWASKELFEMFVRVRESARAAIAKAKGGGA